MNFNAEVSYFTLYPNDPPILNLNLTGTGVPGKGIVNITLSPVLLLGWFLFVEVPVFPYDIEILSQLAVILFVSLPLDKLIVYFSDTVLPKIFELARVQLLLNDPSQAKFLNCFESLNSTSL